METAAVERKSPAGGSSVVVAALGDALANTHFFSGSGMSVGMYCIYV
jgi:2-polyprenyl-6-methoxyphenol hydroxylase-like FAD-dependent oxidoreductase